MTSSSLIRLGGLAAMVGGVAYAVQGFLAPPLVRLLIPADAVPIDPALEEEGIPPERIIPGGRIIEDINLLSFVLLLLGAMAVIAALHALQRELYGPGALERYGLGALTFLASLVGVALILVGDLGDIGGLRYQALAGLRPVAMNLFLNGLLVATIGILALGVVTIAARKLPWWCGAALIAGSPPVALFLGPLLGVAWALVGYAVFRAGGRRAQQPSRVR
jgi:hypothetical protein